MSVNAEGPPKRGREYITLAGAFVRRRSLLECAPRNKLALLT